MDTPHLNGEEFVPYRRQKHLRACEQCRRRKVLCDASEKPNSRCTRCTAMDLECEFNVNQAAKSNGRPKSYVEALEERLRNVERLLGKLTESRVPVDLNKDPSECNRSILGRRPIPPSALPQSVTATVRPPTLGLGTRPHPVEGDDSEDEAEMTHRDRTGYHGKSSTKSLVFKVLKVKGEGTRAHLSPPFQEPATVPEPFNLPIFYERETRPYTIFPPPDLLQKLVDAYFENFNIYLPILHRPTFEMELKSGLHLRDRPFGALVLLVCANGTLWLDHPGPHNRIFIQETGFEWIEQVMAEQWSLFDRPKLHDIQALCLLCAWLNNTDAPQGPHVFLALGIRLAVDVGAHRKKVYSARPTVEGELWKRAFWALVNMDRVASFGVGRPSVIQDEDFDLDPISECDDEYWLIDGPFVTFQQPPGKPSKLAFANVHTRLLKILAFSSRTLYTINKSKLLFGFVGAEWKQEIVAELDSALNRWFDSIPAHLRWDPNREDPVFFTQSACLYTSYYQIQIAVHRQFLPSLRSPPPPNLALPSLTICTSAARSCINVLEAHCKRIKRINWAMGPTQMPIIYNCVVLLISLWGGKPSAREAEVLIKDVGRCLALLSDLEAHGSHAARKVRAALSALVHWQPKAPASSTRSGSKSEFARISHLGDLLTEAFHRFQISLDEADRDSGHSLADMILWQRHPGPSVPEPSAQGPHVGEVNLKDDAPPRLNPYVPWIHAQDSQGSPKAPQGWTEGQPSASVASEPRISSPSPFMGTGLPASYTQNATAPTVQVESVDTDSSLTAGDFTMTGYDDDFLVFLEDLLNDPSAGGLHLDPQEPGLGSGASASSFDSSQWTTAGQAGQAQPLQASGQHDAGSVSSSSSSYGRTGWIDFETYLLGMGKPTWAQSPRH